MKIRRIIYVAVSALMFGSCSIVEPELDNTLYFDQIGANPGLTEGLLLNAYAALPGQYSLNEAATDDAVSNNRTFNYLKVATGEWSSLFNPFNSWKSAYTQIYYTNLFLDKYDSVRFSVYSENQHKLHKQRLKGEAYGLRAYYEFQLLQRFSGKTAAGELLGFPIVTKPLLASEKPSVQRNSFDECVQQIVADLDTAIANLPATWVDKPDPDYNACMGARYANRMNGNSAKALKSRMLLFAASQAFNNDDNNTEKWEKAATASALLIKDLGGISSLTPTGIEFWNDANNKDIIWRDDYFQNNDLEKDNFPPSLWGAGNTNPTQNFVDAFPMANGYPLSNSKSGYLTTDPYKSRDPRLAKYVVYNGLTFKSVINTYQGATKDGINQEVSSTRTGYYLKKLLSSTVNLDPNGVVTKAQHIFVHFRATETFLNFAEAANEAWGPKGDPTGIGFTATDVLAAIRKRAGLTQPDAYLTEAALSTDDFRALVRNERRIELSFEGFRFWDIRRWNDLQTMKQSAMGVLITKPTETTTSFDYTLEVEKRNYQDFMIYGPIPYYETLKYDALKQNQGW